MITKLIWWQAFEVMTMITHVVLWDHFFVKLWSTERNLVSKSLTNLQQYLTNLEPFTGNCPHNHQHQKIQKFSYYTVLYYFVTSHAWQKRVTFYVTSKILSTCAFLIVTTLNASRGDNNQLDNIRKPKMTLSSKYLINNNISSSKSEYFRKEGLFPAMLTKIM